MLGRGRTDGKENYSPKALSELAVNRSVTEVRF